MAALDEAIQRGAAHAQAAGGRHHVAVVSHQAGLHDSQRLLAQRRENQGRGICRPRLPAAGMVRSGISVASICWPSASTAATTIRTAGLAAGLYHVVLHDDAGHAVSAQGWLWPDNKLLIVN